MRDGKKVLPLPLYQQTSLISFGCFGFFGILLLNLLLIELPILHGKKTVYNIYRDIKQVYSAYFEATFMTKIGEPGTSV